MRTINPRLQRLISNRGERSTPRRLRPQLVADGVVASYIHDISARHGGRGRTAHVPVVSRRRPAHLISG